MKRQAERELSKLLWAWMGGHEIACFDVLACQAPLWAISGSDLDQKVGKRAAAF
jgi:hypothetical protein